MSFAKTSDNWYRDWFGEDYLKVYPHRDDREAQLQVDFVERALPLCKGDYILDLGCGNGRHASELSNREYFVTCFDLSPALLLRAKQRGSEPCCIRFVQGDMRYLPFQTSFDSVVSFFTTFGYFESDEENLKTLQSISRVLKPGGKFSQDYMNKSFVLNNLVPNDVREQNGYQVTQQRSYNASSQRIEKKIVLDDGTREQEYFESVRLYDFKEMTALIERAQLSLDQIYGDFDGQPFTEQSPRLILIGHRESS